jgi:hypothetical protein
MSGDRLRELIEAERRAVDPPAEAAEACWTKIADDARRGLAPAHIDVAPDDLAAGARAQATAKVAVTAAAVAAVGLAGLAVWRAATDGGHPAPEAPAEIRAGAPHKPPALVGAQEEAAPAPRVAATFARAESRVTEAEGIHAIEVVLTRPAAESVAVEYFVSGGTATAHDRCTGTDFVLDAGRITIEPGRAGAAIPLRVRDDALAEGDESVIVTLTSSGPEPLGAGLSHTVTIVDDDRGRITDVRDFGARGDGRSDDTAAIESAIGAAAGAGPGVVHFPRGVYVVRTVRLRPGLTYVGPEATILRAERQGNWTRTLVASYSGDGPSAPLHVQGLTVDGNLRQQGPYRDGELEQAHLMVLAGDRSRPGRLQAVLENVSFESGPADGLLIDANVQARICHLRAADLWQNGVRVYGGNSTVEMYDVSAGGFLAPASITVGPGSRGHGGSRRIEARLEKIRALGVELTISVSDGSRVVASDVLSTAALLIVAPDASVSFQRSTFLRGLPGSRGPGANIIEPSDVRFSDCEFVLSETAPGETRPEDDRDLQVARVSWSAPGVPPAARHALRFDGCRFRVGLDVEPQDTAYVVRTVGAARNSEITISGGTIDPAFDGVFSAPCAQCRRE